MDPQGHAQGIEFRGIKKQSEQPEAASETVVRKTSAIGMFGWVGGWVCGVWWLTAPLVVAFESFDRDRPEWSSGPAMCALLCWAIYSIEGLKRKPGIQPSGQAAQQKESESKADPPATFW